MSWNYRVIKEKKLVNKEVGYYDFYRIAEVYYDKENKVKGWSDNSTNLLSQENYEDLKGTSELMIKAFEKPVLIVRGNDLINEN